MCWNCLLKSFWSVNSNEESLSYSKKAISYSWANLNKAVKGEDVLKDLAKAAYFAGKAINLTKTTGPHALSYGFTTKFNFLNRQLNCPSNVEEFLTFIYGNWKKPLRTSNKKVYLTKNFKKQPLFYTIIIEKIFKKIYKIFKTVKNLIILKWY